MAVFVQDKLKRVVRYLTYREIRQKAQKQMGVEEDDSTEIGYAACINSCSYSCNYLN